MIHQNEFRMQDYRKLPSVNYAKSNSSKNWKLIENLGDLILEYGFEKLFGISILHKHFDMKKDEILVRCLRQDCIVTTPISEFNSGIACHWKVGNELGDSDFSPLEFLDINTFDNDACDISRFFEIEECHSFRSSFANLVRASSAENEIGIMSLHASLALLNESDGSSLVEDSHDLRRTSVIRRGKIEKKVSSDYFRALWTVRKSGRKIATLSCSYHCRCE